MALKISTSFIYSSFRHLLKSPICLILSTHCFSSNSQIRVFDYLINQHQFPPEIALKASSTRTYVKDLDRAEAILSLLKEFGLSKSQIEKVVQKVPHVLCANIDNTIKPKIKIFQELGFSSTEIADIIAFDPRILFRSADNLVAPSVLMLRRILGSHAEVCKFLRISGLGVKSNLEKILSQNMEVLKSCGVSLSQMRMVMLNFPRFLMCTPETMKCLVKRVDELGFDRKSKMYLYAIRTMNSMSIASWVHKLHLFESLGFSEHDIMSMFKRYPHVFAISEKKIKEGTQLLFTAANLDISYMVKYPDLLIRSVEHTLRPRIMVMEILEKKNLLKRKPTTSTVLRATNKEFLDKYVIPYSHELRGLNRAGEGSLKLPTTWIAVLGTPGI